MNKFICSGRFCADPILIEKDDKIVACRFTLAVAREMPQIRGQTDFIDFISYCSEKNNTADYIRQYCRKGMLVEVVAEVHTKLMDREDKKFKLEQKVVYSIRILSSKKEYADFIESVHKKRGRKPKKKVENTDNQTTEITEKKEVAETDNKPKKPIKETAVKQETEVTEVEEELDDIEKEISKYATFSVDDMIPF